jgi:hypothetical protein
MALRGLFPIIGDPIKYVESPQRLTRTFEERGYKAAQSLYESLGFETTVLQMRKRLSTA